MNKINLPSILRLSMPVLVPLYCISFNWSYVKWVSPVWSYLGLTYNSPDPALLILGYALASILSALSPLKIRRPSQVIYWVMFFTVYIPGLFVPLFVQLDNGFTLFLIQLCLTGAMLLITLSYRINLLNLPRYPLSRELFWTVFFVLFVLSNLIMLVAFHNDLHLASLKEVYKVRIESRQIAGGNVGIGYFSGALSSVMNPFLIAYGLSTKKRKFLVLGIAGQVFLYATAAMKSILISPILIVVFYYSLRKDRGGWAPKTAVLFTGLFFALTTLAIGKTEGIFFNLASAILLRSFALPGLFIAQYQYFFENFPHTYLGHVTGINLLFPSPYTRGDRLRDWQFFSEGRAKRPGGRKREFLCNGWNRRVWLTWNSDYGRSLCRPILDY